MTHEAAFDDAGSMVRWTEVPGGVPARIFVHGLGGTAVAVFGDVALGPALGGRRTLLVDLPGHGLSDRPAGWGYSLEQHAMAVARACEAAGVSGVDLVGHSLGADVSIVVAARNPGLVGRLVLSEGNLDPLPVRADGDRFSQRIVAQGEEAFVRSGYDEILAAVPTWRPTLRLASPVAVFRSARELLAGTRPTMRELLHDLRIPRTFLRGDRGEPLLDEAGLVGAGVRIEVIADAGHMIMEDAPAAYRDALLRALELEPA